MYDFEASGAVGAPPTRRRRHHGHPDPEWVSVSGATPAFPPTDGLSKGTFTICVTSGSAIQGSTPSNYTVNVTTATGAPRTTPVTKVTLVDVDIPATQALIEPEWDRIYTSQGVVPGATTRDLAVEEDGDASTRCGLLCLPMPFDAVTSFTCRPGTFTVVVCTQTRAPYPIREMARAWDGIQEGSDFGGPYVGLRLLGVPGRGGEPYLITASTKVEDDSPLSFTITDPVLYGQIAPYSGTGGGYLTAGRIPGPSYLAIIVTRVLGTTLPFSGSLDATYFKTRGVFQLSARAPCPVTLTGGCLRLMGFGPQVVLDGRGTCAFGHPPDPACLTWASLPRDSPVTTVGFTASIQTALDLGTTAGGSFVLTSTNTPTTPTTITLTPGWGTLGDVVEALNTNPIMVAAGVLARVVDTGVVFEAVTGAAFNIDFTTSPNTATRFGYLAGPTGFTDLATPTACAGSLPYYNPLANGDVDAIVGPGRVVVRLDPDTDTLRWSCEPFPPFEVQVSDVDAGARTLTLQCVPEYLHGLTLGASVLVGGAEALRGVVVLVPSLTSLVLVMETASGTLPVVGSTVTALPFDRPPLDVYLLGPQVLDRCMLPDVVGCGNGDTLETTRGVCSLGTLRIHQDPFVLIALGFEGTEAEPLTGSVYYPSQACPIVFAKVPRTNCFQSNFQRLYEYTFEGTGRTLGFIKVRVLNPNGTLYQTHGHPVAITLCFVTRENGVGFGPGTVTVARGGDVRGTGNGLPAYLTSDRQTFPVAGGRAGVDYPAQTRG
jgi:hypothetical protein